MSPLEKHIKESWWGKLTEAEKFELAAKGLWPIVRIPKELMKERYPDRSETKDNDERRD